MRNPEDDPDQLDEIQDGAESDQESGRAPVPLESVLAVVLAAGAGTRFSDGKHKLQAELESRPLVWWATRHAIDAGFAEVLVVEGSIELTGLVPEQASIVRNHDWADGQARSLQVAVHYAELVGYEAIVIGLGDQPFVPPEAWRLVAAQAGPIATARFGQQVAPPVRLHSDVWGLLPLDGDEGARRLLRSRPELVVEVACPGSAVDVDTVVELDRIRRDPLKRSLGKWT